MTNPVDIEAIGDSFAAKLTAADVASLEDLRAKGSEPKGRKTLIDDTGLSHQLILKWVNRTDLAQIKGIATQYANLLEITGVDTVPELVQRNADNLHTKMIEVNAEKNLVRKTLSTSQVSSWVSQAKALPRTSHY